MTKRSTVFPALLLVFFTVCIASASPKLTEDAARNAASQLLAEKSSALLNWVGLLQISDYEMHGRAVIQHHKKGKMIGNFIFHRTWDGKWVIDSLRFIDIEQFRSWKELVFQMVE